VERIFDALCIYFNIGDGCGLADVIWLFHSDDFDLWRDFHCHSGLDVSPNGHIEIVKANMQVLKAVLSPDLEVSPTLVKIPLNTDIDIAETMFANSITLTPGTVSVDMKPDHILVHALLEEMSAPEDFAEMEKRLGRLIGGPTLYDRLLAVNSFGTKTILFLCVFCFVIDRPDGVDIALLYALMNFIATIAILKFFNYKNLGVSLLQQQMEEDAS